MEIVGVFFKTILEWLLSIVPAAILRSRYSEDRLAQLLEVDLRSTNPVVIMQHSAMPEVSIWLRMTNLSPFEIMIEQCTIDLWLGQPMIKQIALGHSMKIGPRATVTDVYFTRTLADNQIAFAKDFFAREDLGKTVYLYGTLSCRTRIRTFTKRLAFERRGGEAAAILQ